MKKTKFLILSAAAMITLAGCGNNPAPTSTPAPSSSSSSSSSAPSSSSSDTSKPSSSSATSGDIFDLTANITFWHTMGKTNQATLNLMITEFNKVFPNITIEHTSQGGYDELKSAISDAIPADTTPTMAYCYSDHVAEYLAADAVIKMDKYIDSTEYGLGVELGLGDTDKSDFIQTYWNEGNKYTIGGVAVEGMYSLPFSKSTEVMFYNKTKFDKNGWSVPETWDELWTLCKTIKETPEYSSVTPFGYDNDANLYITLSEQMDIPYTTGEGTEHFLFVNDDAKAEVKKLKDYVDKGYIATQNTLGSGTYTSTKFTAEELFMSVGSTGGTRYNYPGDPSETFEVGIAPVPQANAFDGAVISQGPSICFFSSASKDERLAAWLFYKFITNTHNSAIYSVLTGYNPVRTSSFSDPAYTDRGSVSGYEALIKKVQDYLGSAECGYNDWYYSSPAFKGSSTARIQVGGILGTVFNTATTPETIDGVIDEAFDYALQKCKFAA